MRRKNSNGGLGAGLLRLPLALLCLASIWTFTLGASSCSSDGTGGAAFVTDLVIRNAAGAPDTTFAPGEPIVFELSVRNRARTEAVLQFSTGQQFDFVVLNNGTSTVRWKWSQGRAFVTIPTEIEFGPGETKTFTATWNQVGNDGLPVGAGTYEARGAMMFSQFALDPLFPNQLGSPLRQFIIQ